MYPTLMKKAFFRITLLITFWASANATTLAYNLRDQIRRIEVAQLEKKALILILNRSNEDPVEFNFQFLFSHKKSSIELVYLSHQDTQRDQDTDPIHIKSVDLKVLNFLPAEAFDYIILAPCSDEEFKAPVHPRSPHPMTIFKLLRQLLKPYGSFYRGLGVGEIKTILERSRDRKRAENEQQIIQDSILRLRQQMINEDLFSMTTSSYGQPEMPFPILDQNRDPIPNFIVFLK
jgi:hypothetical protein